MDYRLIILVAYIVVAVRAVTNMTPPRIRDICVEPGKYVIGFGKRRRMVWLKINKPFQELDGVEFFWLQVRLWFVKNIMQTGAIVCQRPELDNRKV